MRYNNSYKINRNINYNIKYNINGGPECIDEIIQRTTEKDWGSLCM